MAKALIIGAEGQDGTYLRQLLEKEGHAVIGVGRQGVTGDRRETGCAADIRNPAHVLSLIRSVQPSQLYFLAAFHGSSEDALMTSEDSVREMFEINTLALHNFLLAIASACPDCRLFYAASSLIFGNPASSPQNEDTPLNPVCPYGISKAAGIHMCRYYRATRDVYACVGVLYNHESPLRSPRFISRKITRAAAAVRRDRNEKLVVGDLDAVVDWGYAPDYVQAMYDILALDEPDLFVIGSGVPHTIRDFVKTAFDHVGLDWREHVMEDKSLLQRKAPGKPLCADASKLRARTDWRPRVSFERMVQLMVESDIQSLAAQAIG